MNMMDFWILVVPLVGVLQVQIIVRLFAYVRKTNFIRFAILLHILELIWLLSALFGGIPTSFETILLLKITRYSMVFIPSALLMVALSIDENYIVRKWHLATVFLPPTFFFLVLTIAPTNFEIYSNFYVALRSTSVFYPYSVATNMAFYFAFVLVMLMNMDQFYRLSKYRILYFMMSFLGSTLPSLISYLISYNLIQTRIDTFSLFVPVLSVGIYLSMELPRLRFFDSVQLSNMISNIDYPIAIYDLKGKRLGFNIAYRDDIYPSTDFSRIESLKSRLLTDTILAIKDKFYQVFQEDLYNEGKYYAVAVYFNDVTSLRKNILDQEEKIRKLDALNDQLLEEMVIQEKLIQETNRQQVFDSIQQDLLESYQHALSDLRQHDGNATYDKVAYELQTSLTMLRGVVKELRSQAEEIMDVSRLIETCLSLYDPQRLKIEIEPSHDLTVLTFAQASSIYLAIRQILDFATMQPECFAADIVIRKENGRPILVTGLSTHKKIEDSVVAEFERNVLARGMNNPDGLNLMNSQDGCIIYAVLEP